MKKLLNKPWFVATLAAIALLFVGQSLLPWLRARAAVADAPTVGSDPEPAAAADAKPSVESVLQSVAVPGPLRDPFAPRARPAVAVAAAARQPDAVETVKLSALWTQHGATWALINDRILQAGDDIGSVRIESASQDGVWVRHWKGRDFIALGATFSLVIPAAQAGAPAPL